MLELGGAERRETAAGAEEGAGGRCSPEGGAWAEPPSGRASTGGSARWTRLQRRRRALGRGLGAPEGQSPTFPCSSGVCNPPGLRRLLALLRPQLGPHVPARWAPRVGSVAPLTRVARVAPDPSRDGAHPPLRARPRFPRSSLPPQLALPGRAPAAGAATAAAPGARVRRPGTRRGAGAAPNRPRILPALASRFPESLSLSAELLREPRRAEGGPRDPLPSNTGISGRPKGGALRVGLMATG
nr:sterile alpha motif domain-containing protein 1-like [Symphalangus syndactylus]